MLLLLSLLNISRATTAENCAAETMPVEPCGKDFTNKTFNPNQGLVNIFLLAEIHGTNEANVANCLNNLMTPGDRLLIESPAQGKEVPCDDVHQAYKRFNGKFKCYGFDIPIDKASILYNDYSYRVNFLAKYTGQFIADANSGKEFISNFRPFANFLKEQGSASGSKYGDPKFNQRQVDYFLSLTKRMQGLTLPKIEGLLVKENDRLYGLVKKYEKASRLGPTNDALVQEILKHTKQLAGSQNRLFVVAGANHVDPKVNRKLAKDVIQKEAVTWLIPRL